MLARLRFGALRLTAKALPPRCWATCATQLGRSARFVHSAAKSAAGEWPWWVQPTAGGDRFVYVGNLPFWEHDVGLGLRELLHKTLPPVKCSITVSGWDNHRRKARDEGKLNRGHAVLEFESVCDATNVVAVLAEQTYAGRRLKVAQGLPSATHAPLPLVIAETDEQRAGRDAKRVHARESRRRRKQRLFDELELLLSRLLQHNAANQSIANDSLDEAINALYRCMRCTLTPNTLSQSN